MLDDAASWGGLAVPEEEDIHEAFSGSPMLASGDSHVVAASRNGFIGITQKDCVCELVDADQEVHDVAGFHYVVLLHGYTYLLPPPEIHAMLC